MKNTLIIVMCSLALCACASKKRVTEIDPAELPVLVGQTLNRVLPGLNIYSVERAKKGKQKVYHIDGEVKETRYQIEIAENGEILVVDEKK